MLADALQVSLRADRARAAQRRGRVRQRERKRTERYPRSPERRLRSGRRVRSLTQDTRRSLERPNLQRDRRNVRAPRGVARRRQRSSRCAAATSASALRPRDCRRRAGPACRSRQHRVDHALGSGAAVGELIEALREHRAQAQQSVDDAVFGLSVEPPHDRVRVAVAPAVLAGDRRLADAAQTVERPRWRRRAAAPHSASASSSSRPLKLGTGWNSAVSTMERSLGSVPSERSGGNSAGQCRRDQLVQPLRSRKVLEMIRAQLAQRRHRPATRRRRAQPSRRSAASDRRGRSPAAARPC